MQLLNSERQCSSTCDRENEQKEQTFASERVRDETQLLREQVTFFEQYLHEQVRQQQAVEQELYEAKQELERMNLENQQLIEEKLLFLKEMKEFAQSLSADQGTDRRALMKLLNKFCNDLTLSEKVGSVEMNSEPVAAVFRPSKMSKSRLRAKEVKKAM